MSEGNRKSAGRQIHVKSKAWGTPQKYVKLVRLFFDGLITLDPCSNKYSIVSAETEFMLPKEDGLKKEWDYPTIFVNPPYGADRERGTTIKDWLHKCVESSKRFDSEILALIPVATNTTHWKQYVFGQAATLCFLYDTRLKFLENGASTGKGAPMACAMVHWGKNRTKFYNIFNEYGAVVDINSLKKEIE